MVNVSIHATLAGGDVFTKHLIVSVVAFLSTPPSRVATQPASDFLLRLDVSIHATLAGGDLSFARFLIVCLVFLSTPPSRVATSCAAGMRSR